MKVLVPTLEDLRKDKIEGLDAYNLLINQEPPKEWLRVNPYANNSVYLPIERVEFLLKAIYKMYKWEVREVKQIFNGVSVTVRLHYKHPISGEWMFQDGTGASQIQTSKGSSPADLANINHNAIQLCVPIAKAEAKKNACKELGTLFGSDLNRQDAPNYKMELIPMGKNHPNWQKLCDAVEAGEYTPEKIQEVYNLQPEDLDFIQELSVKKLEAKK